MVGASGGRTILVLGALVDREPTASWKVAR
jgi:hypothetical protein